MPTTQQLDAEQLGRLIEAGRALLSELDADVILERVLSTAREITGARYAALGVLDDARGGVEPFHAIGIDDATRAAIGEPPRGRGILGVLIDDPWPLRLADLAEHPASFGFPPGHPPMRTFLGVPIVIRGEAWGNLYLAEKDDGEFTEADEEALVVLADWAAIAIDNARLYRAAAERRDELEQAVRGLEANAAVARAVGAETDLQRVLALVARSARALLAARSVVILLREDDILAVRAAAGATVGRDPTPIPVDGTTAGEVLRDGRPCRIADAGDRLAPGPKALGVPDATSALLVPLVYRGRALGILAAFDRLSGARGFSLDDEALVEAFAAQAATAVATAQTVHADRLRRSLRASEAERRRWARELHDETLQSLGALKLMLAAATHLDDADAMRAAIREAAGAVGRDIDGLRSLIAELRPAALDQLGLEPALASLAARTSQGDGPKVTASVKLGDERLAPELETTVYRIAQEALTNVVKHAHARRAVLAVSRARGAVHVVVADDGRGVAPGEVEGAAGFGVLGMRERAALAGGELSVAAVHGGTTVTARLPLRATTDAAPRLATEREWAMATDDAWAAPAHTRLVG